MNRDTLGTDASANGLFSLIASLCVSDNDNLIWIPVHDSGGYTYITITMVNEPNIYCDMKYVDAMG